MWTYIADIDHSNLRSEKVHLEGLLPVGDQLRGHSNKTYSHTWPDSYNGKIIKYCVCMYLCACVSVCVFLHQREVIRVNPDDAEIWVVCVVSSHLLQDI